MLKVVLRVLKDVLVGLEVVLRVLKMVLGVGKVVLRSFTEF